jgi:hypothetical protein
LLTLPVVLLVPIILVPIMVLARVAPTLTVTGSAVPGGQLTVVGLGFGDREQLMMLWDGAEAPWLPKPTTDGDGAFATVVQLPASTTPGVHALTAQQFRMTHDNTTVKVERSAVASVTISAQVARAATPAPSPIQPPTPVPSVSPTHVASPTASASPSSAPPTPTPAVGNPTPPPPAPTASPVPVAPPAVGVAGYGANTAGGRGGRVVIVSNLNDSGPGSLREAINGSGARIVVFTVAGTIVLKSDLMITDPFLTIDGGTAPGPVVLRGAAVRVVSHDVILRNLRLRPGDQVSNPAEVDAITINGLNGEVYNVVLDHMTMIWGPDIGGVAILGNVHDVTVQYSIMGEGLYLSAHPEGVSSQDGHSMAASIFQLDPGVHWAERLTFHHNLFTTSDQRMPVVQGAECVDFVNNVVYNWGNKGLHGNPRALNVVNSWFRSGPATTTELVYMWQHHSANPDPYPSSVYLSGNVADGFPNKVEAPSSVLRGSAACGALSVNAEPAQAAYATVVGAAGATLPVRDAVDQRIIANVLNRTGTFFNGAGESGPNPYWP